MNPNLQLIFFAHPRSGSSSLFEILQLHPALHLLEEPFNENFTRWYPNHPDYRQYVHDRSSLDGQLARIFVRYNGLKVLNYQLPDDLLIHMLHHPDRHVLFLRRRNLLQTVVSVLIAEQTRLWKKWDMTKSLEVYYRNLKPLDIDDVKYRVLNLHQHLEFCEAVIDARSGITAMKLFYEDFYFSSIQVRNQHMRSIWLWLGLVPLKTDRMQYYLDPAAVKINSSTTYGWVPNAHEIEQSCGNSVTG